MFMKMSQGIYTNISGMKYREIGSKLVFMEDLCGLPKGWVIMPVAHG